MVDVGYCKESGYPLMAIIKGPPEKTLLFGLNEGKYECLQEMDVYDSPKMGDMSRKYFLERIVVSYSYATGENIAMLIRRNGQAGSQELMSIAELYRMLHEWGYREQ